MSLPTKAQSIIESASKSATLCATQPESSLNGSDHLTSTIVRSCTFPPRCRVRCAMIPSDTSRLPKFLTDGGSCLPALAGMGDGLADVDASESPGFVALMVHSRLLGVRQPLFRLHFLLRSRMLARWVSKREGCTVAELKLAFESFTHSRPRLDRIPRPSTLLKTEEKPSARTDVGRPEQHAHCAGPENHYRAENQDASRLFRIALSEGKPLA
jgi:hypothetical protein